MLDQTGYREQGLLFAPVSAASGPPRGWCEKKLAHKERVEK